VEPEVERLLTVTEVAQYLRLSNMTVYRLIRQGQLPAMRVGRSWRVREDDLTEFLAHAEHDQDDPEHHDLG